MKAVSLQTNTVALVCAISDTEQHVATQFLIEPDNIQN